MHTTRINTFIYFLQIIKKRDEVVYIKRRSYHKTNTCLTTKPFSLLIKLGILYVILYEKQLQNRRSQQFFGNLNE